MSRFSCRSSLIAFSVFVALTLTPISAFAQHGGGGGHSGGGGGGGFHGGGGGGFHGGSGGFHGGAVSGGSARGGFEGRSGGFNGGGRSLSGGGHQGGLGAGRNVASSENHSSNLPRAVSDGQWHSFGNAGASARSSEGRTSGSIANSKGSGANSNLLARNTVSPGSGWYSFGSTASGRGTVASRDASFHGGPSANWRGGGWGGGWRGFGCCGFGWGGFGWGWGPAWGFGWNWGLGFGWPYWGGYWGLGWNPWSYGPYAYNPYWYAPLAYDYSYDPDYTINWDDNPPPYRLGSAGDHDAASHESISLSTNSLTPFVDTP